MEKTLDLYITKLCNLNCEYCYVDIGHDTNQFGVEKFMQRKNLLDYDHIKFFGGEPLLKWKEIQKIILSVRKKKTKVKFTIVSNGVLVNQEICNFIKKHDVSLVVSVHMFPGADKLRTQVYSVVTTLSDRKYDFLFVLNRKSYPYILRDIKILFKLGVRNFHITPDSSVFWDRENLKFLSTSLGYLRNLALNFLEVTFRFADTQRLLSDTVSCKKEIYYGNSYKPCNRFTKMSYFGKELLDNIYSALDSEGFYNTPYRYFFSCPIGYFLDHIESNISFKDIAQAYISLNLKFIDIQKQIDIAKQTETFLTIAPVNLRFNLTNQCNIRCKYCYVDFDNSSISSQEIINILTYFLEIGIHIQNISFFGGEPLLEYKKIEYVVPLILQLYKKFGYQKPKFQIATNAILLSNQVLKTLKSYDFEVHISYGGDRQSHDLLRDGSFEKVDTTIKDLGLYKHAGVIFLLMLGEESVDYLFKNYLFLVQRGAKNIHLECIFTDKLWKEKSVKILKRQIALIFGYDRGNCLQDYSNIGVYDISVSGNISRESLSFHGIYNLEIKETLDLYIYKFRKISKKVEK